MAWNNLLAHPQKSGDTEYFPFLNSSLLLYSRICTTESQMLLPMVSEQTLTKRK